MNRFNTKQLRAEITEFTRRSTCFALMIFTVDIFLYITTIVGAIFLENPVLRLFCSIIAGLKIASLFVIAHDAAHDSFTSSRVLNGILARISFLPSLHNYSLWLIAHNRLHHQLTNIKGKNSWSPLSKEEYDAMPAWRRIGEQFYRCPAGICFNYLIERWWKYKFIPFNNITGEYRLVYWLDFLLVVTFIVAILWILTYAGSVIPHTSPFATIVFGFVIPLMISYLMIGFTVYQQHTHESIPWFKSSTDRERAGYDQENITMYVQFPYWYNLISHNAMEHTAHHIDPRIPFYNLPIAQKVLDNLLGKDMIKTSFSWKNFLKTMAICKLYDYENHFWTDFYGNTTSGSTLVIEEDWYENVA